MLVMLWFIPTVVRRVVVMTLAMVMVVMTEERRV